MTDPAPPVPALVADLFRVERARVLATLVRLTGSVDRAEEIVQETMISALEKWPSTGVPDNPGAWLMTAARNRALDLLRAQKTVRKVSGALTAYEVLARAGEGEVREELVETQLTDDQLRLVFTCCHPLLSRESQVALTLRLLGGLSTEDIARAFLVPEPTIAQRIVRAKRTIAESSIPYEIPPASELPNRLPAVLEVVYLVFNEGYTARTGDALLRIDLHVEAIRLATLLAELMPKEPEVLGLLALLELQASRHASRTAPDGSLVRLADQDRTRWDRRLVERGLAHLEEAQALGPSGTYALQARIAACHARADRWEDTDWHAIVAGYDDLLSITGSPIVALNRVVALRELAGPARALDALDAIDGLVLLESYHLLHVTRGELLLALDRRAEARASFERALELTENERERAHIEGRLAAC